MTRNFYKNWQRLISGIMLAILLMLNTVPIAHAVTKPHHQKSDQQNHNTEIVLHSHSDNIPNNQTHHSDLRDCLHASCHFYVLSTIGHQQDVFVETLKFYTTSEQLVGIFPAFLDPPPKTIH